MDLKKFIKNHPLIKYVIVISGLLTTLYFLDSAFYHSKLKLTNVILHSISPDGRSTNSRPVELPFTESSSQIKEYLFTADAECHPIMIGILKIIPDDHFKYLKVNEKEVDLSSVKPGSLNDWQNGFIIDIGKYLKEGKNTLEFKITDEGFGKFGLNIVQAGYYKSIIIIFLTVLFFFFPLLLLYIILKDLGFDRMASALFLSALFVFLVNFLRVDYNQYTYDLEEGGSGHLNYVEYVANHYVQPRSDDGWVYYHPPLYYYSAALLYNADRAAGMHYKYKSLQFLSLIYFFIFLIFGAMILRRMIPQQRLYSLALALLVFWPSGFIHSIRIGNDVLFCALFAAGLYFTNEWHLNKRNKDLYLAVLFACLDFMTKSNGAILVSIIIVLLLVNFIKSRDKKPLLKQAAAIALVFAVCLVVSRYNNFYYALQAKRSDWLLAGLVNVTAGTAPELFVGNKPVNYLYFDMFSFLTEPYAQTWVDKGGRQYFWNFLLKSSLFGEFVYPSPIHIVIAYLLNGILFLMTIYFAAGCIFFFLSRRNKRLFSGGRKLPLVFSLSGRQSGETVLRHAKRSRIPLFVRAEFITRNFYARYKDRIFDIILLSVFFSLVLMLAYRINKPLSALADFRYIYPTVISFGIIYVFSLEVLKDRNRIFLVKAGFVLPFIFAALSGLFFLF